MAYQRRLLRDFEACQRRHPSWPVVISEGDSWFSYPFHKNVVDWLDDPRDTSQDDDQQQWSLLRLEKSGDEILSIMSGGQRARLRLLLQRHNASILLFSGGGNDIVGPDLLPLLRSFRPGMTARDCLDQARLERRLRQVGDCYCELMDICRDQRPELRIVVHGYDYPIPSDRPVRLAGIRVAGPWLRPYLVQRGLTHHALQSEVVRILIDRFNGLLSQLREQAPDQLVVVDTRHAVGGAATSWANEIHPTREGFMRVAQRLLSTLHAFSPGLLDPW